MDHDYRIVSFGEYCSKCEYEKKKGTEEPCNECLEHPMNEHTDKPTRFEAKKNGK